MNGVNISENDFAKFATRVRDTAEKLVADGTLRYTPTFFEQITAIALLAFAEAKVELAILETGLGGRLDATTAANAEIAAITRIDFDHQQYLGETIEEIAAEKAAIIRPDSKVVIGEQYPDVISLIETICWKKGVIPKYTVGAAAIPPVGLSGRHQRENAKVALLAAGILGDSFQITAENVVYGLKNAHHVGRLEFQDRYLFDGAHNVGGANALRDYLDEFVDLPITLVFGAMNDKNAGDIAEILFPKADAVILTQAESSRAMPVSELVNRTTHALDRERVYTTQNVAEALEKADEISQPGSIILVTGSLYLVGEAKKILQSQI